MFLFEYHKFGQSHPLNDPISYAITRRKRGKAIVSDWSSNVTSTGSPIFTSLGSQSTMFDNIG